MRLLIPFIKLDSFFTEDLYVKGEAMIDNKEISLFTELYKGKVLVVFKDSNKVEMRFNKESIVDVNCTCDIYRIKKACPHLVAASLEVRKKADKLVKKPEKRKTRVVRKSKSRFNDIIKDIDIDELKGFVKSYASKDKNFRLFFEAFFMNKLKDNNIQSSYGSLLDEVLPPSSDVNVKFSRQQITLLTEISKDLINQYKDEISLKRFIDAFEIIKHLLNKLSYVTGKVNHEKLNALLFDIHKSFFMMFDEGLAPELKTKGYDFIYEMIEKSYYFYKDKNDLIHLFLSTSPLKDDINKLIEVLRKKIIVIRDDFQKKYYIAFYIGLKKRFGELEKDWYSLYFHDMTDFMEVSKLMLQEGFVEEHEQLLKELYSQGLISKRLFLDTQLRISLMLGDCERVGYLAYDVYENTGDFRYLKQTKDCVSKFPKSILKKISNLVKEKANEEDLLSWFVISKNNKDLLKFLHEKNDINLIQKHEIEILRDYPDELEKLYLNHIHDFLNSHFGEKSAIYVKELLYHLRKIDAKKIAFHIEKDLFDTFSTRKRFLKDLMGF